MVKRIYDYEKYISRSEKYKNFLEAYKNKTSTHRAYKYHLAKFFTDMVISDPDNYFKDTRRMNGEEKIFYLDGLEKDFKHYWQKINKEMRGKTPYIWLSAIKMFCTYNKTLELDNVYMEMQRNGHGNYAISKTRTPTKTELLKIFSYSNPESKALFMFQLTSGQRIEQVVNTTFDDIEGLGEFDKNKRNYNIPRIYYTEAKQKHWVKTRITPEAKKYLIEYLQQRDKFIQTRIKRGEYRRKNDLDLNKIFPMDTGTANAIWTTMVKNAGLYSKDKNTGKPELGTHCLRRYFLNHFKDREWGDYFSGHITPRNKEYRQYSDEKLDDEYKKSIENLTIFAEAQDLTEVNEEITLLKKEKQQMQDTIAEMKAEITELRLTKNEKLMKEILKKFNQI